MNILNILFPKRCPYCSNVMELDNKYCCDNCKSFFTIKVIDNKLANSICVSPFIYGEKYKQAILNYKFHNKPYYSRQLANALFKCLNIYYKDLTFDVVTCVPLSKKSLQTRQYNQSKLLAKNIAKHLDINYLDLLTKFKCNSPQHTLPRDQREKNVIGVYKVTEKYKDNNFINVLLIDDIMTTGYTLQECVRTIKHHYNCNVFCATLAVVPSKR